MGIVSLLHIFGIVSGDHQGGIISAILFLIPGFPMVTSMLDLARQDFSSALSRAAYVLVVMASAGVAVWTVTFLFHWEVESTNTVVPNGIPTARPAVLLLIHSRLRFRRTLQRWDQGFTVGGCCRCFGQHGTTRAHRPSCAVAVGCGTGGRNDRSSRTAFRLPRFSFARCLSVPAVVIMIPGVPFYRAISALNNQTVEANVAVGQAAGNLTEVFFVITAIGVGLAIARILTDHNWRHDVDTSGHIVLPESHGSASEPKHR